MALARRRFYQAVMYWLPLGIAVTLVCGLIYATVQQNYRQSLNDPQIQMAEDTAAAIIGGASPTSVVPQGKMDIAETLSPWVAVYSPGGTPIAFSGTLNGVAPALPSGVFNVATWNTSAEYTDPLPIPMAEDRFTWQPRSNVRQAVVVVHAANGMFIASGRNMREGENRESALELMVGIGWIVTLIATCIVQVFVQYFA